MSEGSQFYQPVPQSSHHGQGPGQRKALLTKKNNTPHAIYLKFHSVLYAMPGKLQVRKAGYASCHVLTLKTTCEQ